MLTEIVQPAEVHRVIHAMRQASARRGSSPLGFLRHPRCSRLRRHRAAARPTCARPCSGDERGWHEVEADDGAVLLNLKQVLYLRVESDEHRVGF